jgi:NADH-quinone oxidoreductase subunit C
MASDDAPPQETPGDAASDGASSHTASDDPAPDHAPSRVTRNEAAPADTASHPEPDEATSHPAPAELAAEESASDDLATRWRRRWPGATPEESYGQLCLDVPAADWVGAITWLRDEEGFVYFDWLSAVDELEDGFSVVVHLWDLATANDVLVRTRLSRTESRIPTLTGVFRGASWHERETLEMFGIVFEGHPNPVPLLLPDGFEGHPLRKEFLLVSRAAKAWPGAKEPGESDSDVHAGAPGRRKTLPPGVPDPSWGPRPPGAGDA